MKLADYMTETGASVASMALDLGVTKEAVRLWMSGLRTPRPQAMSKIFAATGGKVTANDFALSLPPGSPFDEGVRPGAEKVLAS